MCCQHVNRLASCLADSRTHAPPRSDSRSTIWLRTQGSVQANYRKHVSYCTALGGGKHFRLLAWMLTREILRRRKKINS